MLLNAKVIFKIRDETNTFSHHVLPNRSVTTKTKEMKKAREKSASKIPATFSLLIDFLSNGSNAPANLPIQTVRCKQLGGSPIIKSMKNASDNIIMGSEIKEGVPPGLFA
jgi:hypothetical protein